jgi:hypothetical protein
MLDDLGIRNYSPSTVRAYIRSMADFAEHFNRSRDKVGTEEIRSYELFLLNEKRVKLSTLHSRLSSRDGRNRPILCLRGVRSFSPTPPAHPFAARGARDL